MRRANSRIARAIRGSRVLAEAGIGVHPSVPIFYTSASYWAARPHAYRDARLKPGGVACVASQRTRERSEGGMARSGNLAFARDRGIGLTSAPPASRRWSPIGVQIRQGKSRQASSSLTRFLACRLLADAFSGLIRTRSPRLPFLGGRYMGWLRVSAAKVDTEHVGHFRRVQYPTNTGLLLSRRPALPCARDQFLRVDLSQAEQHFRLRIEPGTDSIECRGDMLAHRGGIRAAAAEGNLLR